MRAMKILRQSLIGMLGAIYATRVEAVFWAVQRVCQEFCVTKSSIIKQEPGFQSEWRIG